MYLNLSEESPGVCDTSEAQPSYCTHCCVVHAVIGMLAESSMLEAEMRILIAQNYSSTQDLLFPACSPSKRILATGVSHICGLLVLVSQCLYLLPNMCH